MYTHLITYVLTDSRGTRTNTFRTTADAVAMHTSTLDKRAGVSFYMVEELPQG